MLRNSYRLVTLLVCFSCCTTSCKLPEKEPNHISPDIMTKLMVDIHMAETYSTMVKDSINSNGKKNPDSLAVFYKDILAHYDVTMEQFSKSLEWYKAHPNDMDTLYNNMIPILTKMQ